MRRFSIILFSTLVTCIAHAQDLFTNSSLVVIEEGVPFTIMGNASNGGMILNEGALRLSGDWANSGDYSSVSGTFLLNGLNQSFDPGNSSYSNLEVDNATTTLQSDLNISGELNLTVGLIAAENDSRVLILEGGSITGGSQGSYIGGQLFTFNQGDFLFPIGTAEEYLPIELAGIEMEDSIGVQAFSGEINAEISRELDSFSPNRFWQILDNSGFSASGITLPVIDESFIESDDQAIIAFTESLDNPLGVMGVPSLSGSLISGSITSTANIRSGYYVLADQSLGGPPITVINVVTSLQDGKHDFLRIENIEFYENNLVEIFDRQGVKVFEMSGYNNIDKVFRGSANVGGRGVLTTGSYYYTVKLTGSKREAGFVYVKN